MQSAFVITAPANHFLTSRRIWSGDALFAIYERDNLPREAAALACIRDWVVKDGERVALTCFERRPHQCHRHCVAKAVARGGGRQTGTGSPLELPMR
jgi:Protein of unknown function, DUF488